MGGYEKKCVIAQEKSADKLELGESRGFLLREKPLLFVIVCGWGCLTVAFPVDRGSRC